MALPISPDRDPALPSVPVAPPLAADHLPLPGDGLCDGRDGLAPASPPPPAPGAASCPSTTPDPAASCCMPDRPLSPPSQSSASSAVSTRPSPPRDAALRGGAGGEASASPRLARRGAGGEDSPLPDRCWDLFCQGHSFAAIGRTLGLHRETAARHVRALHQQVQADRRADRALALSRALATQERIQATAWTLLAQAQAQATAQEETPPSSSASSASSAVHSPVSSLADCARLLTLILASAREAARLDLLYDRDAPARKADQDDQPKAIRLIIERVGDPYVDPLHPTQLTQSPTSADSSSRGEVAPSPASPTPALADPSTVSTAAGSPPPVGERPVSRTTPLAQPADDPGLGAPRPNPLYSDPRRLPRPGPRPPAAGVASADP